MPSIRSEFSCDDCPLRDFVATEGNDEYQEMTRASAKSVAYHAGLEGEPSDSPELEKLAKKCAKNIVGNSCDLWCLPNKGGGFIFKEHN